MLNCLSVRLPKLMSTTNIGLIIIDSVAGIFRTTTNYNARAIEMRKFANQLLKLSRKNGCAVLCINQVRKFGELFSQS